MKKLFIGLLVLAAGTTAFFYFNNKNRPAAAPPDQQEQIVGTWKTESVKTGIDSSGNLLMGILGVVDSNLLHYHYQFTREGNIRRMLNDTLAGDSSRYAWNNANQLIWTEAGAQQGDTLSVIKLNNDTLQLQSSDSVFLFLTKLK